MDYLRGKSEKWIFNERHQNLFKSVYSEFENGSTSADTKEIVVSRPFLFKFQSFRISFYLLLCKVWKHKVNLISNLFSQCTTCIWSGKRVWNDCIQMNKQNWPITYYITIWYELIVCVHEVPRRGSHNRN